MGDFSDIRAEVTRDGEEVQVDFIVTLNFYNNVIRIDGLKTAPHRAGSASGAPPWSGRALSGERVREAIGRLQDSLRDDGFYQANNDLGPEST